MTTKPIKLIGEIHVPIWSGDRISQMYHCYSGMGRIGEVWVTSPNALVATEHGEIRFGEYLNILGLPTPPLIKLIDASAPLSIQVHPSEETAKILGGVSKSEVWYVLSCDNDASILYGTKQGMDIEAVKSSILSGEIEDMLNIVPVSVGDVYPIPCGMLHSLGGGITVLEVQDKAGTTYRVKDISGNRETHRPESLESVREISFDEARTLFMSSENSLPGAPIISSHLFSASKYASEDSGIDFTLDIGGVCVFCENGKGSANNISFTAGDTLFVPTGGAVISLDKASSVILIK